MVFINLVEYITFTCFDVKILWLLSNSSDNIPSVEDVQVPVTFPLELSIITGFISILSSIGTEFSIGEWEEPPMSWGCTSADISNFLSNTSKEYAISSPLVTIIWIVCTERANIVIVILPSVLRSSIGVVWEFGTPPN